MLAAGMLITNILSEIQHRVLRALKLGVALYDPAARGGIARLETEPSFASIEGSERVWKLRLATRAGSRLRSRGDK